MNEWSWGFTHSRTLLARNVKRMFRNPESLIVAIVIPIVIMLLFVFVFGGAIRTGTAYVNYVVPGIIITCVGYSSSLVAMAISQDMTGGLYNRLRTMPVHPVSLLFAHVAGSFVRNALSASIVFAVALAIGFRPNASFGEWLAVIGLLALFLLAFSWLGLVFGLLAKTPETASAFAMMVMFLPYISSAFVPTDTMPRWLAAFAANQPLTPIIESLRSLLIGTTAATSHWIALGWLLAVLVASCAAAVVVYNRRAVR